MKPTKTPGAEPGVLFGVVSYRILKYSGVFLGILWKAGSSGVSASSDVGGTSSTSGSGGSSDVGGVGGGSDNSGIGGSSDSSNYYIMDSSSSIFSGSST
jgi:hypothetical protein